MATAAVRGITRHLTKRQELQLLRRDWGLLRSHQQNVEDHIIDEEIDGSDYVHPRIELHSTDGSEVCFVATDNIAAGTLLIRELAHTFCDSTNGRPEEGFPGAIHSLVKAPQPTNPATAQLATLGLSVLQPRLADLHLGDQAVDALAPLLAINSLQCDTKFDEVLKRAFPSPDMPSVGRQSEGVDVRRHIRTVCSTNATYSGNVDDQSMLPGGPDDSDGPQTQSLSDTVSLPIKRSLLNHSCRANATTLHAPLRHQADGYQQSVCYVRAVDDIAKGS